MVVLRCYEYGIDNDILFTSIKSCSVFKPKAYKLYIPALCCPYLWNDYEKSTFSKIRVAFNNAYRKIFGLHMFYYNVV